jgi:N-acetylglucosamine-6-phosphate deacetylase
LDALKRLVDAANGWIRLVTLAPECDPNGRGIEYLAQEDVLIAAGHCNPSIDQLRCAIDSGLSLFTHLGNACPASIPRHENIIHRVLSLRDSLRVTLIADGFHLPLWLLDSWVDWFGEDRVAIVSDAISAAGLAPGIYQLGAQKVAVGADGVPRSADQTHFVGSGATLGRMRNLCESHLSWSSERIEKLFKTNARGQALMALTLVRKPPVRSPHAAGGSREPPRRKPRAWPVPRTAPILPLWGGRIGSRPEARGGRRERTAKQPENFGAILSRYPRITMHVA